MKTYVFPGQGIQKKGMGGNLFDDFANLTKKADKILGYSIKELCHNNPDKKLDKTQYTQPAIYVVNALLYKKRIKDSGETPDYLAGHSLGEYNALHAAGVFSFEKGLKLVKKRSDLMSQSQNGAMAAILNCSEEQIKKILVKTNLTEIDIANLNSPSQIVISGMKEDIKKAQRYLENENIPVIRLNTSGAFHSRYMEKAEKEYGKYLNKYKFIKPKIPIISNVTAKPYEYEEIGKNLANQICNCVRWTDSIIYLLDKGEMEFEEVGASDVLTKLIESIREDYSFNKENIKSVKATIWKEPTLSSKKLVDHWNNHYPTGTKIYSDRYKLELETRTEAMLLFGFRAAVYAKGYNGYFDLKEVTPAG